jgi:hypothetical protein
MAKLTVTGRLGQIREKGQNKEYISFGVAEPSYKKEGSDDYITPWFNFLVKADSPTGKFLKANAQKIEVVVVNANERQTVEGEGSSAVTKYFHNVTGVEVITWKKVDNGSQNAESVSDPADSQVKYPWDEDNN